MNLYESEILEFVRTRLDELSLVESDMLGSQTDDRNLDATIQGCMASAIAYVHGKASAVLLEGREITQDTAGVKVGTVQSDGSVEIDTRDMDGISALRLVSFKAGDSDILISEACAEDSAKARMQLNAYTRGTYDEPVLVERGDSTDYKPHYVYYSAKSTDTGANFKFSLRYFPVPTRETDSDSAKYWFISPKLKEAVLNEVTGLTLRSYKEEDNAKVFLARALEYMQ